MVTHRTFSESRNAILTQTRFDRPFLTNWLSLTFVLAATAWPVVLETDASGYTVQGQAIYRALHRHFRQKSLVETAMQDARPIFYLGATALRKLYLALPTSFTQTGERLIPPAFAASADIDAWRSGVCYQHRWEGL
jgi:hypothetical protein